MVDLPPGRTGKPFFKVCVDRYEYPNRSGTVPRTNLAYADAAKLCEQHGKRLCTALEWSWACGGLDGLTYPYGKSFEQDRCNSDTRLVETSGNRINCSSPFGGFDMVGNVFEWVSNYGKPALMGGPFSKCQTVSPSPSGNATPQSGLRCCKGN
jgi:formylglycine-generating enzyme